MNSEPQPISSPSELALASTSPRPSNPAGVARWRWWIALLIIGSCPLLAALSSLRRAGASANDVALLPSSVPGLLWFCALQMGAFGVFWVIFWAFSRANKDQLWLPFSGFKSLAWGILYSVLMRFSLALFTVVVLLVLTLFGFDINAMMETIKAGGETMKDALAPALKSRDPLYRFLLITLISFVVAGLREELWRAATLAGILHLTPKHWNQARKNGVALGVSSVLFGMGHLYQGLTGVVGTTLLGLVLGFIMLHHRSVWPAVMAHGCFNAVSFAAMVAVGNAK